MKRFRFPLEALRALRRRRREEAERVFAAARARRDRQILELSSLTEERRAAEEDFGAILPGKGAFPLAEAMARRAWVATLTRRVTQATRTLEALSREAELRRLALLEASRHEKVVDRLRERRREAWAQAAGREDQAAADEAGLGVFRKVKVQA